MRNFKNLLKLNKKDSTSTAVFGVPLDELFARSKGDVPNIVEHVVQNLEESGLDVEGIFRVSGSATLMQILKKGYDEGKIPDKITLSRQCDDCHAMAGLLKMWIRDLPEPLHTYALYDAFVKVCSVEGKPERIKLLRELLNTLPQANFVVLKYIMEFLHKVGMNSDQNKMSYSNLAVVFAPTVFRPAEENLVRMMADSKVVNIGMIMLMEDCDYLFGTPDVKQDPAQVVPVLKVDKYDDAGYEEAEKRKLSMLMDTDDNDRAQRRLSSKQSAQRNLDYTPEKDKPSRRPRLTIQTPNSEEDPSLNAKFMISPARPPHSPSKSPHVHPIEYSPALLDLVSETVNFLFESTFNVDDTLHLVLPEKEHRSNPTTPTTPKNIPSPPPPVLSMALPASSTPPLTTYTSPATNTKHYRVPAFDSSLNLQEHLRLHLPASPTAQSALTTLMSPTSPASDVSFTSTPSPLGGPISPAFSPSSAPANIFAPTLSSSPEISRNPRRQSVESIFPPVSPRALGSPLARSGSPSLSLEGNEGSPRRHNILQQQQIQQIQQMQQQQQVQQQVQQTIAQPQPLHTRVLHDSLSRNLSLSTESIVASSPPRPSLFDTARSLQNLPSPSSPIGSPSSPVAISSPTQRIIESRSLQSLSPSPPLYDRLLEPTRSFNSLVTPHPRSQLHITTTSTGQNTNATSSVSENTSPRPLSAPVNRQRSHSESTHSPIYNDTPRPTSSLANSPTRNRDREFGLENGVLAAYLGPNGKRNARQRAESPIPDKAEWGGKERDKDNIYHVKRNRKSWAPENIQNIYETLLTSNTNSNGTNGSPTLGRRERDKESSPRRTSSPRPATASPRISSGSSGSPRNDDTPLGQIQCRLEKERKQSNRPNELQLMTTAQIREEKIAIKRELREFDNAYKKKTGHLPKKSDKEVLRPLYQRYRDVKDLLTRAENPALPTRTSSPRRATTAPHKSLSSTSISPPPSSSPRISAPISVYSSVPNLQPFTSAAQQLLQQQQQQTQLTQQTQQLTQQQQLTQRNATQAIGRASGRRATMSFGYDTPLTSAQQQQQQQQQQQKEQKETKETKEQKEQQHYRTLSHAHNKSVPNLQKELSQPIRSDLLATYKSLKSEKKQLQIMLHQYQNDFVKKHGRKVQFVEDREPVRVEYERYKDLKTELATLEEQLLAPAN